jgi:hypothetical protein
MTQNATRMEVNAAIEKLIMRADDNGEAAKVVVEYGSKLQKSGRVVIQYSSTTTSSGDEVSGYSPGHGEITISDKKREENKEWAFGIHKDRVGYFRLWKSKEGELRFHHFWKSSAATKSIDSEGPEIYCLGYDPVSFEPKYLCIEHEEVLFTLWFGVAIEIFRLYREQIYGTVPKMSGGGLRIIRLR